MAVFSNSLFVSEVGQREREWMEWIMGFWFERFLCLMESGEAKFKLFLKLQLMPVKTQPKIINSDTWWFLNHKLTQSSISEHTQKTKKKSIQHTVKTDLINTCDTQEIKFSTATTAEIIFFFRHQSGKL